MRDEWKDTMILTWRCCLLSLRNPDTLLTSVMLPGLMMALFVFLFGTLIQIGDMAYVDYIVPGVLLQCVGQCSSTTSVMVCREVRTGMAGRLCILPIFLSSRACAGSTDPQSDHFFDRADRRCHPGVLPGF